MLLWKQTLIAVVNSVVGLVRCGNKELRIDDVLTTVNNLVNTHWIHVVNNGTTVDLVTLDTEITSFVPKEDGVTNMPPLPRAIEPLIDPTIEPERRLPNCSSESQVLIPLFERWEL